MMFGLLIFDMLEAVGVACFVCLGIARVYVLCWVLVNVDRVWCTSDVFYDLRGMSLRFAMHLTDCRWVCWFVDMVCRTALLIF